MSFKIGELEIKKRVILAPMAGITSFSYRKLMSKFGCGLFYSEMISDCGLLVNNVNTTVLLQDFDNSDHPLAVQLFGGKTETLLKAIDKLDELKVNYEVLDLNLACPVYKVIKSNGGSSWLKDQEELFKMVSAVVKKSKKPVSCKIRLGFDSVNVNETVKTLEKAGVSFIAIHARTRNQLYIGEPDYEALKDVRDIIKIPFCISGNIFTVEDALKALKITRADCVMVARGGVGNPELINNINLALDNKGFSEDVTLERQIQYLKEYALDLVKELGETKAVSYLKGIAPKFFNKVVGSKELKNNITQNIKSIENLFEIIDEFKKSYLKVN